MKKLLLLAAAVVFSFGMDLNAQSGAPAKAPADAVQTEIRAVSGQLKETYSAVYGQLNQLNKEIEAAGVEPTAVQSALRTEMTTTLSQLEGMLTTVNTADEAQWADIKAKATMISEKATALVEKRKAGK